MAESAEIEADRRHPHPENGRPGSWPPCSCSCSWNGGVGHRRPVRIRECRHEIHRPLVAPAASVPVGGRDAGTEPRTRTRTCSSGTDGRWPSDSWSSACSGRPAGPCSCAPSTPTPCSSWSIDPPPSLPKRARHRTPTSTRPWHRRRRAPYAACSSSDPRAGSMPPSEPIAPQAAIATIVEDSATDLASALRAVGALLPSEGSRRVVVLTDSVPTVAGCPSRRPGTGRHDIAIDVVEVETGRGQTFWWRESTCPPRPERETPSPPSSVCAPT